MKLFKSLKEDSGYRRAFILRLLVLILVVASLDAGFHRNNYYWYDWLETLSEEQQNIATDAAARYQLSGGLLDYEKDGSLRRTYSVQRREAKHELRSMGYRGALPSPEWPAIG